MRGQHQERATELLKDNLGVVETDAQAAERIFFSAPSEISKKDKGNFFFFAFCIFFFFNWSMYIFTSPKIVPVVVDSVPFCSVTVIMHGQTVAVIH